MKDYPLISIIVPSYKNYKYIYETLDSILLQDYPNIEIVISNDGTSDFDQKAVENYLKNNSGNNIKNYIVNNNSKNLGTVKNLNIAVKLSKGEFITFLAADDVLYNKHVVTKFIDCFNSLPKNEMIIVSQVGMYDIKLKKLIEYFISEESKKKIINLSPQKLFGEMSNRCILPGSGICYKRKIFEKYGYFDEKYILVEDYSLALKLSRLGVKYNYFDFISSIHRDGGISHGNVNGETHESKQYDLDILNIYKNEVLPYTNLLTPKQKKVFIKKLKEQQWNYSYRHEFINGTKRQKILFLIKNWKIGLSSFFSELSTDLQDLIKGKKFQLFIAGSILMLNSDKILYKLGIFLFSFSIFLTILFFGKKYLLKIFQFIKFIF